MNYLSSKSRYLFIHLFSYLTVQKHRSPQNNINSIELKQEENLSHSLGIIQRSDRERLFKAVMFNSNI